MARYGMAIDLRRCAGCGGCVVACQMQHNQSPGVSWNVLDSYEWGDEVGESGRTYVPHACMQCDDPPCVHACPTGASMQRDDGIVVVDYDACIACGFCISACPYQARRINETDAHFFGAYAPAPYEAFGVQRSMVVEKCIFCEERLAEGLKPACVSNCPGKARYFGDLDDPESDVSAFLASHDAVRVDETACYYLPVAGTPEGALPFAIGANAVEEADAAVGPAVVGIGVGVAAAAAAGVAYAARKARMDADGGVAAHASSHREEDQR